MLGLSLPWNSCTSNHESSRQRLKVSRCTVQRVEAAILGLLGAGGALARLLPFIKGLRERADRKEVKGRLRSRLLPTLRKLQGCMEDLNAGGQEFMGLLTKAQVPIAGRKISNELRLEWANIADGAVEVVKGVQGLAGLAEGIVAFETFMERLKRADPGLYELLKLLQRSYDNGALDLTDFPTFLALYGPKKREGRKLKREVEQAVGEAAPLVEKAGALRLSKPFNRHTEQRVIRSFRRLAELRGSLRGFEHATPEELADSAPEWMQPLRQFTQQLTETRKPDAAE